MDKTQKLYRIRHSLAHLLAMTALEHDPGAKLTIGPVVDNGFYYDIDFSEGKAPTPEDLKRLQKAMKKLAGKKLPFTKRTLSEKEARTLFADNPYKMELIEGILKDGEKPTVYDTADFTDLCEGPHVENTGEIDTDGFKLDHIAGAYWRGSEKNKMLTRIYGLAFETGKELDEYIAMVEEAKKRDHKKLGADLDLFFMDEKVGKGLPMWTPKGTAVRFALENFTRDLERKYGYEHVITPYLGSENLYKTSGHLDHYTSSMYAPIDMDGDLFYLRPMACPHHIRMYQRKAWSYRDLPVRYAEIADYNRYEKSGELMGMIRVRKFTLTDAHLFVTPEQLKDEFKSVCALIKEAMEGLGMDKMVSYRFSKRDPNNKEKYFPDDALWNKAESLMKTALDEMGFEYAEAEDEAAFYGPKLDVQAKNVNGKEDTLFTAQIDFLLPEKFDMTYIDADGTKKRPVMIHRSVIGALERTLAFLIEHYAGAFPFWLSPEQVWILPITDAHAEYAKEVQTMLKKSGIRTELHDEAETLGKKIRNGKMQKIPYLLVIGDKEVEDKTVTIESRSEGNKGAVKLEDLIKNLT
jgi:threonyl-tRNA synthetase